MTRRRRFLYWLERLSMACEHPGDWRPPLYDEGYRRRRWERHLKDCGVTRAAVERVKEEARRGHA